MSVQIWKAQIFNVRYIVLLNLLIPGKRLQNISKKKKEKKRKYYNLGNINIITPPRMLTFLRK